VLSTPASLELVASIVTHKVDGKYLPTDAATRKATPIATGVLDYFPKALAEVAKVSRIGNEQHNGVGTPLHWDKSKSSDHADCLIRHLLERGTTDTDGALHSAKVAWRALALLEQELEHNGGIMPYKSKAQAAFFNVNKKKLEKKGVDVNEWNAASKGKKWPKKVKSGKAKGK
jgi:hypothetical protein